MGRQTKDSCRLTMNMERSVFERMKDYCERSGQTATTAIEKAVTMYIDRYDRLEELAAAEDAAETKR